MLFAILYFNNFTHSSDGWRQPADCGARHANNGASMQTLAPNWNVCYDYIYDVMTMCDSHTAARRRHFRNACRRCCGDAAAAAATAEC